MNSRIVGIPFALSLGVLAPLLLALGGCGGGGGSNVDCSTTPCTVVVSWDANHETAVNSTGGGYTVYYSTSSGFNIGDGGVTSIDVPYVSGPTAPISTTVDLLSGTYYFRVQGYSTLTPAGPGGSTPAAQVSLVLP
jgi:hypothetical protein